MNRNFHLHPVLVYLGAIAVLTALAPMIGMPMSRVTEISIYVLYAMGVNLLLGYTGLLAFGASLFFGTGTYVAAIVSLRVFDNEVAGLIAATVFSAVLALVVGLLVLQRRGIYFSLLTLAFSQLAFEIAFKWTGVTGGENGLQGVGRPMFESSMAFHLFAVALVGALIWFIWAFVHSPVGRVLQAIRDNEERAACLGYRTFGYKLTSFIISGSLLGIAGGLLAYLLRGAYANNLNWAHAADAVLMSVLGGVHHFLGPVWGAIVFVFLRDQISVLVEHWWLVFAPLLILFVLASPDGLMGIFRKLRGKEGGSLIRDRLPPRPDDMSLGDPAGHDLAPGEPVLQIRNLSKSFGALVTARDISFDVMPCTLHSLIGPNGAGKTTFFNMISGLLPNDGGQIIFRGRDISNLPVYKRAHAGLARSFQIISLFEHMTAFETVRLAVQARDTARFNPFRDALSMKHVNDRAWRVLAAVRMEDHAGVLTDNLSHGEQRLLDIAIVLATGGDLLLLDEPLAGLSESDREIVSDVVVKLAKTHAVMMIEHDLDRVMNLSDRITVLHQGRLIADGDPQDVARSPEVIQAYIGELDAGELVESVAGSNRGANRTTGEEILVLKGIAAGYEGSRVVDGLNLTLRKGEVLALLGRNGVGKTTTLKAITGTLPLQEGEIFFKGTRIDNLAPFEINKLGLGLVPEGRRLFPNLSVVENLAIAQRPGGITLAEAYDIFPKLRSLASKKASSLSGGERQMVAIVRALMYPADVVLLDEPFEGLAPVIVKDVMTAILKLRERCSVIIVEHNADLVLPLAERAVVLVNGRAAFDGKASDLLADEPLRARLLGLGHATHAAE
tara:strand:+ start:40085 stop:42607 length:2523 start_codon:yes stop_codon:yes gene_type:complete